MVSCFSSVYDPNPDWWAFAAQASVRMNGGGGPPRGGRTRGGGAGGPQRLEVAGVGRLARLLLAGQCPLAAEDRGQVEWAHREALGNGRKDELIEGPRVEHEAHPHGAG